MAEKVRLAIKSRLARNMEKIGEKSKRTVIFL
jgi:hypothetical protein